MNYIIEGENYPTLEEVKEILIPKWWNFNKGKEPDSLSVLLTSDDEDLGDGLILGRLRNGFNVYTKSINDRIFVVSYAPFNSKFNADDLNSGLIDLGYKIRIP